jgi:hypothetical protein
MSAVLPRSSGTSAPAVDILSFCRRATLRRLELPLSRHRAEESCVERAGWMPNGGRSSA